MRKTLLSRRLQPDRPPPRWSLTHPAAPLTWDIQSRGKLAVVATVEGELDVDTAPGLSEQLVPLAAAGRHLILNLAGVRFCDCAGLGLFLRLRKTVSASGGSLHLAAPTAPVRRLITVVRLGDLLPITDDPAELIAALNAAAAAGDPGS